MPDELELVKEKEKELSDLYKRMDNDRDLRNLDPYKMRTLDGKNNMPKVANVTLPEPSLFMNKTIAKLASVERQPQVLAEKKNMSDKETTKIEEFIEDFEYEVDSYLSRRGEMPAFNFHSDIACSRGRIAEMITTRVVNKELIPDVRPLDTRYFTSESWTEGMIWGSVKTFRSKAWLKKEYPDASVSEDNTVVRDIWNDKENIVYVGDKEVLRRPNPYGEPPFNLEIVPTGSVLKDRDNLKYEGESVFEQLRTIFPEINFIATTLKTLNYALFEPPVQLASNEGKGAKLPDSYVGSPGSQTAVDMPGAIQPIFTPDIKAYTTLYNDMIKEIKEKAGFSSIDFGQLPFPLAAVAMARLAQGKLELLLPRLQALSLLYQSRYKMVIAQLIKGGETVMLGEEGHRREYSPKQLDGKYTIKFRYFSTSTEELAANAAISTAMGDVVSEDYKRREIYKLPDPDGEKSKVDMEKAVAENPILLLIDRGRALILGGKELEAEIILIEIENLIKQRRMGIPQEETKAPERKPSEQVMSVFGG